MRINAILPGPTDTPLARANADLWLGFGAEYRAEAGVEALSPDQMANTLAFLGSQAVLHAFIFKQRDYTPSSRSAASLSM